MTQTTKTILISAIVGLVATFIGVKVFAPSGAGSEAKQEESVYERVIKTRKLRCGYGLWEPVVMRDPNTGEMSGLFVDIMDEIGDLIGIEVEWTEDISWDQIPTALQAKKFDAHCAGMWASPKRGMTVAFSDPFFYTPVVLVVREDDTRFDQSIDAINDSSVKISVGDDDVYFEVVLHDFPKAESVSKSALTGQEQHYMNLAMGRVDVAMGEPNYIRSYQKKNPGKVRVIHEDKPIRVFSNTIGVDIHEQELLSMINTAARQLVDGGRMKKLLAKYNENYDIGYYLSPKKSWESKQ